MTPTKAQPWWKQNTTRAGLALAVLGIGTWLQTGDIKAALGGILAGIMGIFSQEAKPAEPDSNLPSGGGS